nr:hypothetical protein [bacterium]
MHIRRIVCCLAIVALLAFFPAILRRAWLAGRAPQNHQAGSKQVVTAWVCATWEGDGKLFAAWARERAQAYELAHTDTYVDVCTVDAQRLHAVFEAEQNYWPDVVLFAPGGMPQEAAAELPAAMCDKIPPQLASICKGRAVPIGYQLYQGVASGALTDKCGVTPDPNWGAEGWKSALHQLGGVSMAKKPILPLVMGTDGPGGAAAALIESADGPAMWQGLVGDEGAFQPTRLLAWDVLARGRACMLVGSKRDALRAFRRQEQKGEAYRVWDIAATRAYTDMAYFAAMTGASGPAAPGFISSLIDEEGVCALSECGILPAVRGLYAPKTPLEMAGAFVSPQALEQFNRAAGQLLSGNGTPAAYESARQAVLDG